MFGCLGSKISQVHLRLNKMANADIRKKRNALDTGPRNVDEIALFIPKRQVSSTSKVEALLRNKLNGCSLATPMVFASNDTSRLQPNSSQINLIGFLTGKPSRMATTYVKYSSAQNTFWPFKRCK